MCDMHCRQPTPAFKGIAFKGMTEQQCIEQDLCLLAARGSMFQQQASGPNSSR